MSNSSPEWWSITGTDGQEISLHQWGWSVTTVGGSRYDLPPRRGSDMTFAYRPGQVHRRKLPDARPITLMFFMVGWDPATGNSPPDQRLQWNDNWDTLRRLVYRHSLLNDQRVRLIRRWFLTSPNFPTTRPNSSTMVRGDTGVPPAGPRLLSAFAWAEMTGTMAPTMTGRFRSEFQMDFTLSDPFFYGSTVSTTLYPGLPELIWNDGHDVATNYVQVDLQGPLNNITLTNQSTEPNSYVKFNGAIKAGDTVRLVIDRFTAEKLVPGGRNENRVNLISNYGSREWVSLLPGANKLLLTANGTGQALFSFRPPYV